MLYYTPSESDIQYVCSPGEQAVGSDTFGKLAELEISVVAVFLQTVLIGPDVAEMRSCYYERFPARYNVSRRTCYRPTG